MYCCMHSCLVIADIMHTVPFLNTTRFLRSPSRALIEVKVIP